MDLFGDILAFVVGLFEPVAHLPYSTPFVALVSVLLALISTWATRRFTNVEQMNTDMAEVKEWQAELSEARRTMDPVLLQKVTEKQGRIMTIQGRMMSARMKPMCIFYIPFIIIFGILNAVYGASPVAVLPFNPQDALGFLDGWIGTSTGVSGGFGLYFWGWYFLASLSIGNFVRRYGGIGY